MKKIYIVLFLPLLLFSKVHYAKLEPYDSVTIKSAVSGLVMKVDLDAEGRMIVSKRVVHIDDKMDKIALRDAKESKVFLEEMLKINKTIATGLQKSFQRKQGYYQRVSKLSSTSKTQKDNAYSAFVAAKTQYLSTQEKIISLKKQILDTKNRIVQLQDTIAKKSIVLKERYLYRLMVREGDYVVPGSPLAKIEDLSRAKLVLFLDADEIENIEQKAVYLDDKKTAYHIDKVWKSTDEKFVSSYRSEIYLPAPKERFSRLMKVEIK